MKFFICAFALVAVAAAAPQYQAYTQGYTPGYNPGYTASYTQQPLTKEGSAAILKQASDQKEDGSYSWSFDTENGISAGESNVPQAAGPNGEPAPNVQGGYQYTAPDGTPISIKYTAGEQGFLAEGSAIPVPPPIPVEILRGLEWNAAHPEEEAQWDPAYNKPQQRY